MTLINSFLHFKCRNAAAQMKNQMQTDTGPPLPLSSLRLLVPPLRLVSAALLHIVQRRDIMDYGLVEEFVTTVLEESPDMMSSRDRVRLIMGLRAQVEASESSFLKLVQTLLEDPVEKEHFFQSVFAEEFGPKYDSALQTLVWKFLSRLDKILPSPSLQQTMSWFLPDPAVLEECVQCVCHPQPLRNILQRHDNLPVHLDTRARPLGGDGILSPTSLSPYKSVEATADPEDQSEPIHGYRLQIQKMVSRGKREKTSASQQRQRKVKKEPYDVRPQNHFTPDPIPAQGRPKKSIHVKVCSISRKSFGEAKELTAHMTCHTEQSLYRCTLCGKDFELQKDFRKHQRNVCMKSAQRMANVSMRSSEDDVSAPSVGDDWGEVAQTLGPVPQSKRGPYVRHATRVFQPSKARQVCHVCDKTICNLFMLRRHIKSVHGLLPYMCHNCEESFGNNPDLKSHMKDCLKLKKRQTCSLCGVTFMPTQPVEHQVDDPIGQQDRSKDLHSNHHPDHADPPDGSGSHVLGEDEARTPQTSSESSQNPTPSNVTKIGALPHSRTCQLRHARHRKQGQGRHTCDICSKSFSQALFLARHRARKTGCGSMRRNRVAHENASTDTVPVFSCPHCQEGFRTENKLETHMVCHTGQGFACRFCGKMFAEQYKLYTHVRSHIYRPHLCDSCGQDFRTKYALAVHMRVHTGERPFSCTNCGKSCSSKGNLKAHQRVHSGERPFACTFCKRVAEMNDLHVTVKSPDSIHIVIGEGELEDLETLISVKGARGSGGEHMLHLCHSTCVGSQLMCLPSCKLPSNAMSAPSSSNPNTWEWEGPGGGGEGGEDKHGGAPADADLRGRAAVLLSHLEDDGMAEGLALGQGAVALKHDALLVTVRLQLLWLLERVVLHLGKRKTSAHLVDVRHNATVFLELPQVGHEEVAHADGATQACSTFTKRQRGQATAPLKPSRFPPGPPYWTCQGHWRLASESGTSLTVIVGGEKRRVIRPTTTMELAGPRLAIRGRCAPEISRLFLRYCKGLRRCHLVVPIMVLLLVGAALTALLPSINDPDNGADPGTLRRRANAVPGRETEPVSDTGAFTVVMQTFNRTDVLLRVLNHYQAVPHLQRIIIVWNNVGEAPPRALWDSLGPHPVPVVFKEQQVNSMRNRLQPFVEIRTDAVLMLDDDTLVSVPDISFAFSVWKQFPEQIVGFVPRKHVTTATGIYSYGSFELQDPETGGGDRYSLVLIGAAFFHRRYLQLFQEQPAAVHALVDDTQNCDDIAMNFVVAAALDKRSEGAGNRPSGVFVRPVDLRNLEREATSGYLGMWHRPEHMLQRSYCLNRLVQIYGTMPLRYSNMMLNRFRSPAAVAMETRLNPTAGMTTVFVSNWPGSTVLPGAVSQFVGEVKQVLAGLLRAHVDQVESPVRRVELNVVQEPNQREGGGRHTCCLEPQGHILSLFHFHGWKHLHGQSPGLCLPSELYLPAATGLLDGQLGTHLELYSIWATVCAAGQHQSFAESDFGILRRHYRYELVAGGDGYRRQEENAKLGLRHLGADHSRDHHDGHRHRKTEMMLEEKVHKTYMLVTR
ncbi:hypothetical protein DPEC_G00055470 [Dallia pectoralis]|uniref:Uncharacterized protein n=1 Tax=Dallia pectoralis TaxID=75939 RepID=A0ACC2H5N3_DALPE|nr:hypothetical protein DPEC_G00055470 [Dallia pectoralis]